MTAKRGNRSTRLVLGAAAVIVLLGWSAPARADGPEQRFRCVQTLGMCYSWAASQDGFWSRWAVGLDCELQFVDCVRHALIGR